MHGPQKAYFVSEEKDKTTIKSLIKWGLFFFKLPDNITVQQTEDATILQIFQQGMFFRLIQD